MQIISILSILISTLLTSNNLSFELTGKVEIQRDVFSEQFEGNVDNFFVLNEIKNDSLKYFVTIAKISRQECESYRSKKESDIEDGIFILYPDANELFEINKFRHKVDDNTDMTFYFATIDKNDIYFAVFLAVYTDSDSKYSEEIKCFFKSIKVLV
jgi:hypothetical protein